MTRADFLHQGHETPEEAFDLAPEVAAEKETPMPPNEPASMPFTDEDRNRLNEITLGRGPVVGDPPRIARALAYIDHLEGAVEAARVRELELALEPFARVLADVLPSPEERTDLENHGFDPDEGIPHDLGHDAPTVGDYRRAARVLAALPTSKED